MTSKVSGKLFILLLAVTAGVFLTAICAYCHCQIPCGIYNDDMRFDMMAEHIATIEKSMTEINELSKQQKPDMNQLTRWVQNKDNHADELSHIVTYYFMAQRIKPVDKSSTDDYEKYLTKLTLLHRMVVYSMKSKQTTDLSNTEQLKTLLSQFKTAYFEGSSDKHEQRS